LLSDESINEEAMAETKKDIVKAAMVYSQEGRWDKAIAEYKKLLTLDPTDYNTHNMLGDVYKKKNEDALAYQEYIVAAEAYLKQGLADKANIIYKKIGALDSAKLPDADRKKQILIKKNTEAEKLIEAGELEKAIEAYKDILKISPESLETYQKLGDLYAQKGDKAESLKNLEKIVDVYFKARLFKKALPIYKKIMELQPENIDVREKIAEVYERENVEQDAKREYLFLAEHFFKMRNVEKTDYYAQKAIEFKSIEAHFFKGAALYEKKQYDDAKKELDMLLKFKANHTGALLIAANINRETGKVDEALAAYTKIVKAEEDNAEAHEAIGELNLQKGMKKDASGKFVTAANIYLKRGNPDAAVGALHKILSADPENMDALIKLGDAYKQYGRKKEAADTYIHASDLFKKEGMQDKADEYYNLAKEIDPANAQIVDRAKKFGQETAQESFAEQPKQEIVVELPPVQNVPVVDLNSPGIKASELIQDMPLDLPMPSMPEQTGEDAPGLAALADSMIASGSFDEAIELYQRALALDPANPEIKSKLNAAYTQYAGVPMPSMASEDAEKAKRAAEEADAERAAEAKQKQEELARQMEAERRRREEEETEKEKAEEEKKKSDAENAKRKQQELMEKMEADKKRAAEEAEAKRREKEEEEKRKREAAEAEEKALAKIKQKEAEEAKKKELEAASGEDSIDSGDIAGDFGTVTTAEIFIKQGLLNEAEKILAKIAAKEPDNIEAKMKLDELRKTLDKGGKDDDKPGKGKASKVSYI